MPLIVTFFAGVLLFIFDLPNLVRLAGVILAAGSLIILSLLTMNHIVEGQVKKIIKDASEN